jgi:two-component system NtrC family sensor kinase
MHREVFIMNLEAMARIHMNGKETAGEHDKSTRESVAFSRADRLASVGQLAAGLAHEMNTPLGSISGHAEESLEILQEFENGQFTRAKLADLRKRQLAIMRQANRCSRIATRLLQFAQPGRAMSGQCRAADVIAQVVELFAPTAQEKGIELDLQVETSIPDAPVGASEVEQLLVNLVQNSIDACKRGDTIRIETSADVEALWLIVSDTGCGIPGETLNRIFDPFFTTKPVGQGTGLGLSVCHGIVRSVGGAIEVESAVGRGTRVRVTLPVGTSGRCAAQVRSTDDEG